MSLKQQIEQDIKKAMLAKDKDELRALRAIKSQILLAETEKGAGDGVDEGKEIQILQKQAKQRQESLELYRQQGREDLATIEEAELVIIQRYLPTPLTDGELEAAISEIIKEVGAGSIKDMGKVMGIASKKFAGKADGKIISEKIKQLLS